MSDQQLNKDGIMEDSSSGNVEDEAKKNDDFLAKASMTESYSEILNSPTTHTNELPIESNASIVIPRRRPSSLNRHHSSQSSFPHGSLRVDDGNMTHFVADNLEYKIKTASPKDGKHMSRNDVLPTETATEQIQRQFFTAFPQIDANALNDIEIEAQYLAANLDGITENLGNLLHSISSITADNVDCYKNAVNKLTDCMDANIKTMYTVMAKTEELSNQMKNTEALASRIKDIKRLVDVMDSAV
ncbi:BLOC-1-related complex subunit 6 [Contarinia nasturtii]|uniref:BLOC-1-related complex subunit 6 n=1 Tax=Contarinia nasturtii TaxID=265458 RepID=UPI0012D41F00|nr:BLOC-1-related complex subunit 6 [Contarinia nasturtii]